MIQIGMILAAIAIQRWFSGHPVMALFALFSGLYLMSAHKADFGMRITRKSLVTPVDDTVQAGMLSKIARIAAYAALAGAIAMSISKCMELH